MKSISRKFLKQIDIYGAPFYFELKGRNIEKNTKLGGCYTLILLFSTLVYGSIKMKLWFSGEISPFIFTNEKPIDSAFTYHMDRNYLNLFFLGPPLSKNRVYFVPLVQTVIGGNRTNRTQKLTQMNCTYKGAFCLENDLELLVSPTLKLEQIEYAVQLIECSQDFLEANQTCASQEEMNSFFNGTNSIALFLFQQRINWKTLKTQVVSQQFSILLESQKFFVSLLALKIENLIYQSGYPFMKNSIFSFISNNDILTAQYHGSLSRPRTVGQRIAFAELYIMMNQYQVNTQVQEQKFIDQILIIFNFLQGGYTIGIVFYFRSARQLRKKIRGKLYPMASSDETIIIKNENKSNFQDKLHIVNLLMCLILIENQMNSRKNTYKKSVQEEDNGDHRPMNRKNLQLQEILDHESFQSTPDLIHLSNEYLYDWQEKQKAHTFF